MGRRFYRTGQFARKGSVSVRTLRYYDKVGLLRPAQHTVHLLYERLDQALAWADGHDGQGTELFVGVNGRSGEGKTKASASTPTPTSLTPPSAGFSRCCKI